MSHDSKVRKPEMAHRDLGKTGAAAFGRKPHSLIFRSLRRSAETPPRLMGCFQEIAHLEFNWSLVTSAATAKTFLRRVVGLDFCFVSFASSAVKVFR
jgi:hypothetical protein